MKIYISTDIEGIAGIINFDMENQDSVIFRELYNQQIEWVLEGIQQSDKNDEIEEIVIADSHSKGTNLSYNRLTDFDDRVSLISGFPRPEYMMSTLDESFDQVFFVGYHAGIGKQAGNMDHGYSARAAYKIWINGQYQNETTINAAYAAEMGVPVTLVVGDSGLKEQLHDEKMFPQVKFVETKKSLSRYAAWSYPKKKVRADTIAAVKEVLSKSAQETELLKYETPAELKMQLYTTAQADTIAQLPAVERLDGRTIQTHADSMHDTLNTILALVALGNTQN
ncbi:peptidase [Ligilactobacillus pabuli]|uniref:Peptidase n=1 Tax=Ligilactobacillus pabuli TaxID=2886039 RepID=A0ABQ5JJY8_9LACO|nr:M55 family metallopeptidase [Ligilactobacillus pabuli]GKS81385.1 peptidase [Ligilactobacillus pabuli]